MPISSSDSRNEVRSNQPPFLMPEITPAVTPKRITKTIANKAMRMVYGQAEARMSEIGRPLRFCPRSPRRRWLT